MHFTTAEVCIIFTLSSSSLSSSSSSGISRFTESSTQDCCSFSRDKLCLFASLQVVSHLSYDLSLEYFYFPFQSNASEMYSLPTNWSNSHPFGFLIWKFPKRQKCAFDVSVLVRSIFPIFEIYNTRRLNNKLYIHAIFKWGISAKTVQEKIDICLRYMLMKIKML